MKGNNRARRRRQIIALLFSSVTESSISNALVSSFGIEAYHCRQRSSSELQPRSFVTRMLPQYRSRLCAYSDIDSNGIIDRHDFLADAFWSTTTTSSIAMASTNGAATTTDALPTTTTTMKSSAKDAEFMCQNGALIGEAAVPGAYSSACMGLSERIVPLPRYRQRMSKINGKQIASRGDTQQIRNDLPQSAAIVVQQKPGGSGNTGMTVWNSGLLLTRLLDAMVDELQHRQRTRGGESGSDVNSFWKQQDVMELGCGTGLCSIAAHRLGAKSVMATDGNPRVLQLAETNIRQNCYDDTDSDDSVTAGFTSKSAVPGDSLSTIRAEPLQWGFLNAMDYSESASFVIGADLTYNPGSWDALAETISTVLNTENGLALYLSVGHDGFNVNAEMDGFLSVAKEKGLVSLPDGVQGIDLNELLMRTLSDPEKKLIAQAGGFRVVVLGRKKLSRR